MRRIIIPLAILFLAVSPEVTKAQKTARSPKLVVNVVISQLPYDVFEKFRTRLSDEGPARFAAEGTEFTSAVYNCMQTVSPASLATLTTGVNPSMHGIVSSSWIDYVTGERISLIADSSERGLGDEPGTGGYSSVNIVMPSLGDKLLSESPDSKVISIAIDPVSAIVMGGQNGTAWWMDSSRAVWMSSTGYMDRLPEWVSEYNELRPARIYVNAGWTPARPKSVYINSYNTIFQGRGGQTTFKEGSAINYEAILHSPHGNSLVADFAKQIVANEKLGKDEATDILNVCFDASRYVGERFGGESLEYEDMLYRIDYDLSGLVKSVTERVPLDQVLFVFTSDHGMSESWDAGAEPRDRFNVAQFKTILNSFLGVQFGTGDWVLDYIDRQVYLNHNLVYRKNLSLEEVQNRAATFVLQFRGVSHVLTSTAMQNGYFGASYGHRMQNGFYPRRAGDLMLNLMPGWIEQRPDVRSLPGSMYDYDTHVPLILFGWNVPSRKVTEQVEMTSLAPALARIIGISRPVGSDGETLPN